MRSTLAHVLRRARWRVGLWREHRRHHCDRDPIECSEQALRGLLDQRTEQVEVLESQVRYLMTRLRRAVDALPEDVAEELLREGPGHEV